SSRATDTSVGPGARRQHQQGEPCLPTWKLCYKFSVQLRRQSGSLSHYPPLFNDVRRQPCKRGCRPGIGLSRVQIRSVCERGPEIRCYWHWLWYESSSASLGTFNHVRLGGRWTSEHGDRHRLSAQQPLAWYKLHSNDVSAIGKAVSAGQQIAELG